MDEFDKKHEVVQHLLDMLKGHAVGEVEGGMKKPVASMEKISVSPKMSEGGMTDLSMPHANQMEPASCDHAMCMGGACKYSDGGVVDQAGPERVMESELPEEPGTEHPEPKMGEIEDEDDENNSSAFGMFKRKK